MTTLPHDDKFWETLDEEASAAETFSAKASFGQVSITPHRYIQWNDGTPTDVSAEVFATLPERQRSLELLISINIQEFRPSLDFQYERRVRIGDSDWWATVRPSVEAIMGKGSMSAGRYAQTFGKLNGSYVEIHDVPKQKEEGYNTVKFIHLFGSRDECYNAWKERYGDDGVASTPVDNVPEGWDAAVWAETAKGIKELLAKGEQPVDIAPRYGVEVRYIAALQ
jgi:hypothetical protein